MPANTPTIAAADIYAALPPLPTVVALQNSPLQISLTPLKLGEIPAMAAAMAPMTAAIEARNALQTRNLTSKVQWQIRIGINSGSVVGGIVGIKKYIYDVFGDTINTASRMESNSEAMKINISEATYALVHNHFNTTERPEIEVKGKGLQKMYFIE